MKKLPKAKTEKEKKANIIAGLNHTAEKLGNTRKICKDSYICLLYTSPSPRDRTRSRMPSSA